jgi:phosphotransferase system  glucose/maltose/N-acetylglucosamine-specific IIC component
VKGDGPFRGDVYQPAEKPGSATRWLARSLRVLILTVAVLAAVAILYGIFQVFICDLREVVFRGMPRRAVWLCR